MCDDHHIDFDCYDDDWLRGHYLIASMDGRLSDQELLGRELIRRGQLSESLHEEHMQSTREREPLPRPIIAGPTEADVADCRHSACIDIFTKDVDAQKPPKDSPLEKAL